MGILCRVISDQLMNSILLLLRVASFCICELIISFSLAYREDAADADTARTGTVVSCGGLSGGGPPEKIIAGVVGEEVGEGSRNELSSFTGILCKVIIDQLSNIIVLCGGKARNRNV